MKQLIYIMLLTASIGFLGACSSGADVARDNTINNEDTNTGDLRSFTLEELSGYDGRDGRDAYIAVDGFVYDVTDSHMWPNGLHRNTHQAGQDLSDAINGSPHGRAVLDGIPKIGQLVDDA